MHLVPTQEEVVGLLRRTGAIRDGHFEYPNGLHATEYMQVQLAMRYFQHAKVLSVGLSRLLRANSEIRAMIPELSIVSPDTGGLPVRCGVLRDVQARRAIGEGLDLVGLSSKEPCTSSQHFMWTVCRRDILDRAVRSGSGGR